MPRVHKSLFLKDRCDLASKELLQLVGPYLAVRVELPETVAMKLQKSGKALPVPVFVNAIIDTGADLTVIDFNLVDKLDLKPVVIGSGKKPERWTYRVRIGFPETDVTAVEIEPVGLDLGSISYKRGDVDIAVLLGRDFLKNFLFTYNGPEGTFTLEQ